MSNQLHASVALPPGKKPSIPIGWEAEWPQNRSGRYEEEKNLTPGENIIPEDQPVARCYTD
jgi:hypothetical protein